jgi:hypothetical protein
MHHMRPSDFTPMAIDQSALDRFRDELLAAMRGELLDATRASEARLDGRLARIEASVAEARRHMDVVAAGLRSDIGLVAEGVVTLTEGLRADMRDGFETLDRHVMRLETRLLSGERG